MKEFIRREFERELKENTGKREWFVVRMMRKFGVSRATIFNWIKKIAPKKSKN